MKIGARSVWVAELSFFFVISNANLKYKLMVSGDSDPLFFLNPFPG